MSKDVYSVYGTFSMSQDEVDAYIKEYEDWLRENPDYLEQRQDEFIAYIDSQ